MRRSIHFLFLLISTVSLSQDYEVGASYFSDFEYIEYIHGNLPIIISVPHGGEKSPDILPDRNCADCITVNDAYTQELCRTLVQAIYEKTSCYPFVIINRLHRRKLDANREIVEAAQGNQTAEFAWEYYQEKISTAESLIEEQYTQGLFIDLHGHAHVAQRLELGYLLSKETLMESDEALNQNNHAETSSIKNLTSNNLDNLTFSELIRGQNSLGHFIAELEYPAVPSPEDLFPLTNESYFNGGYNTRTHGSLDQGTIDAIQIECNQEVRFDDDVREDFAKELAEALLLFLEANYFEQIGGDDCGIVNTNDQLIGHFKVTPNPVADIFQVEWSEEINEFLIYNSLGEVIYRSEKINKQQSVDLSNHPKGIYFLIGRNNNAYTIIEKIIKSQ